MCWLIVYLIMNLQALRKKPEDKMIVEFEDHLEEVDLGTSERK